jgi:hypothetical protein
VIVFGLRKFGWVDHVEALGTLATTFVHVMFVPLIPLETHLVIAGNRGFKQPLSVKSIAVAWLRSALFWSALLSWIAIPTTFGLTCLTALPLTIGYFALPLLVRKASPARAAEIRRSVGA